MKILHIQKHILTTKDKTYDKRHLIEGVHEERIAATDIAAVICMYYLHEGLDFGFRFGFLLKRTYNSFTF